MRRAALMAALLAFGVSTVANAAEPSPAQAPAPMPPPRPLELDKNSALILIRSALIALQQANKTGNYSVLYSLSAPDFQKANSPERLAQVFANLRAKNFDLSGVLVLEPQFTVLPEIYSNGVMRMAGFFPSVPMQVYFEVQFAPVEGQWRIIAMAVNVGNAIPAAPTPNPALASSHSPTPAAKPAPSQPAAAKPAPSQSAAAKPESTESPSVEINVRPKPKPTPTPTPKRKV
jgi:hypothetical protein